MDKKNWENKAANGYENYYDTQPGVDVTAAGETQAGMAGMAGEDGLYPPNKSPDVYYLGNIWAVASCLAFGVRLLGYGVSPRSGYTEWALSNDDGTAARIAREFKQPDELVIPVHRIQKAYRTACQVRAVATRGIRNDWHGRKTA